MKTTRRVFLRRGVRGVGIGLMMPTLVPASVLGANSPNSRIGIGLIGTGRQAYHANLLPFLAADETQVVAVCDVDAWRMEEARRKVDEHYAVTRPGYQGCAVSGDFLEILDRGDVDAVMISTPDHWHAVMAVAAARAGKHIALEKPVSLSIGQGRAIVQAASRNGCVFRTDTEVRTSREFRQLRQVVRTGRIGKLQRVVAGVPEEQPPQPMVPGMAVPGELDYVQWLGPAPLAPYSEARVHARENLRARPGWMIIPDYCEGMICNWGAHLIDIVQWTLGMEDSGPVRVEGQGSFHPPEGLSGVLGAFTVQYEYANGVRLEYRMAGRPFIRCEGSDGWVEAEWWRGLKASEPELLRDPIPADELSARQVNEKSDFIDAIRGGGSTLIPAEAGHRTNSVCQLGLIAIQLGRALRWDPANEQFVGDDEANRCLHRTLRSPWHI